MYGLACGGVLRVCWCGAHVYECEWGVHVYGLVCMCVKVS